MIVYLESSAVLRDLLDGDQAEAIRAAISKADLVATSRVTLAEVERVFARLQGTEPGLAAVAAPRRVQFAAESELWAVLPADEEVWARCGRPFPKEPVRMLDAIHLATVERLATAAPDLTVVSTDRRIRDNAGALGLGVAP